MAAFTVYSNAMLEMSKQGFNLASDAWAMILATQNYPPQPDADVTYSNVSAFELPTGLGYTAGGVTLTGVSDTLQGSTATFTADPALWSAFTGTFRYAVIVHRDGASLAPADLLLCFADCSETTGLGGVLSITPDASGIFTLTHLP